ncbi:protein moxZ [Pontibaca methylaminivorans]|uniref:protein moxZ n=1 Tax=Pontibaca methylaminivorans TaxID=515897 RepID=UPI002FD9DB67
MRQEMSGGNWAMAVGLVVMLMLPGCYEDETLAGESEPGAAAIGEPEAERGDDWLRVEESEAPLVFLARRSGAARDDLAPGFRRLGQDYSESPRMIANRVLQLWREIERNDGPGLGLRQLLDDLASDQHRAEDSLAAVIQLYRVQRRQGRNHAEAVAMATGEGS